MTIALPRVARGVTRGGQFATHQRHEADVDLSTAELSEARSETTGASRLGELAITGDVATRVAVAANTASSTSTLDRLSDDRFTEVQRAVANNPRASHAALSALWHDGDDSTRLAVVANPNVPLHVQQLVVNRNDATQHAALAANAGASPTILAELGRKDGRRSIRAAIEANPSCTTSVIDAIRRN